MVKFLIKSILKKAPGKGAEKGFGKEKAFSLVEVMLAVFIFTLFSTGVMYLSLDVLQRDSKLPVYNEALLYAQEGLEAARNIRDQNYLSLTTGSHGLLKSTDAWSFDGTIENIDSYYYRTITIEDVYRDGSGEIASSGNLDPEMKRINSTVSWLWKGAFPKNIALTTYLSGWTGDEWMVTTCTEFNNGTFTDIENESAVAPPADNCALMLELVEEPSSFYASANIGEHVNGIALDSSYAYVATEKSAEGLAVVDITSPSAPSVSVKEDVGGKGRYITKDGDYLYIGVTSTSKSIVIVDVSDPLVPLIEAEINLGAYGNKAAIDGNYMYAGIEDSNDAFVVFDISSPSSPLQVGSLDFGSEVNYVVLDGNYAYLGIEDSSAGFQIVDISTPSLPTVEGVLDLGVTVNSVDIYGSFAFLGTGSTTDSLRIIDISTPSAPSELASVDTGSEINDAEYHNGYVYAAQNVVSEGLAVFNAESPLAPYLAFVTDVFGKAPTVEVTDDYVYMGIDVNNRGLAILETIYAKYASTGTYLSEVLDSGSTDTRYNYLEWEASVPSATSLSFQIRTADTSGGIIFATWVGPDGTNSSYFTVSRETITLDPAASGAQYFQFKAYLTSDKLSTPNIESVTVNYNP